MAKKQKYVTVKPSTTTNIRKGAYIVALAEPKVTTAIDYYELGAEPARILKEVGLRTMGKGPDGKFDWGIAGRQYLPVIAVAGADALASKLGVYKRIARVFRKPYRRKVKA